MKDLMRMTMCPEQETIQNEFSHENNQVPRKQILLKMLAKMYFQRKVYKL
jgi:hypothetical protein